MKCFVIFNHQYFSSSIFLFGCATVHLVDLNCPGTLNILLDHKANHVESFFGTLYVRWVSLCQGKNNTDQASPGQHRILFNTDSDGEVKQN